MQRISSENSSEEELNGQFLNIARIQPNQSDVREIWIYPKTGNRSPAAVVTWVGVGVGGEVARLAGDEGQAI